MNSLELFHMIRCSFSEGVATFRQATTALVVDEPTGEQGIVYGKVLGKQGLLQLRLFYETNEAVSRTEIRNLFEKSLAILRHLGLQTATGPILLGLRELAVAEQQYDFAQQLAQEIHVIFEETGDRRGMVALL